MSVASQRFLVQNQTRTAIDPAQNIDIVFENIVYTIKVKSKEQSSCLPCKKKYVPKQLLKNVSGIFRAGRVSAIMGASGAGKTTLLNVIACRVPLKNLQGTVYANNLQYHYKQFGDFANYVMQTDVLMQTLTVRQTLQFAADLKLNQSQQQKKKVIKSLARQLKLQKCLDVIVGGSMIKGISGGQKKRTSIAFELMSNPQVLMLDQPTSGLDSLTSYIIVRYMRRLAKKRGKTIIMTIHNPNTDIYDLFDDLTLMIDGKLIYQGSSKLAMDYFDRNFNLVAPEYQNPADFLMSIMHQQDKNNVQRYPAYVQSFQRQISPQILTLIADKHTADIKKKRRQVSWATTFCTLLRRDFTNTFRNPLLVKLRLLQTVALAIFIGGLFFRFTGDYFQQQNWRALSGFFFFLAENNLMAALVPVGLVFPIQRQVFLKEQGAKLYSTFPYWLSHNLIELPFLLIFPLITCLIVYWFVGLSSTPEQFFIFYLFSYLMNFNGASIGFLLGSVVHDAKSISTISPLIMMPIILFSGYFKNRANLPAWNGWIQYLSPIKYCFSGSLLNQVQYVDSRVGQFNFDVGIWASVGILIGMGIFFRLVSLFFLWFLRSKLQ